MRGLVVEDERELESVSDPKPFETGGNVRLDGALGDTELAGNGLVAEALRSFDCHIAFAPGQFGQCRRYLSG